MKNKIEILKNEYNELKEGLIKEIMKNKIEILKNEYNELKEGLIKEIIKNRLHKIETLYKENLMLKGLKDYLQNYSKDDDIEIYGNDIEFYFNDTCIYFDNITIVEVEDKINENEKIIEKLLED